MSLHETEDNFDLESKLANDEAEISLAKTKCVELYYAPGNSRALHLVLPDRKRMFLHYSYLVSGQCTSDETNVSLVFSSQTVTIKGRNLGELFEGISQQIVREITYTDIRYNETLEEKDMVVNQIDTLIS